jgi:hypothetical protein
MQRIRRREEQKMAEAVRQVLDRMEIQNVMLRYARGVDRRDWELVRATFFEDGTDHHTDFKGKRDEFVEWVSGKHASVAKSTHFLGNCLIEFASDDVAVVETYFHAILELGAEAEAHRKMLLEKGDSAQADGRIRVEVLGRYLDRFERRHGDWRVAERRVAFDSTHSQPNVGSVDANTSWVLGRRDVDDPIFIMRRTAGIK